MLRAAMITLLKSNLTIALAPAEHILSDLAIGDIIDLSADYCNLKTDNLPEGLEPILRRKVKSIIEYEARVAASPVLSGSAYDVKSFTEGDMSVTFNVTDKSSRDTIYDLTEADKRALRKYRRLR